MLQTIYFNFSFS